MDHVHDEYYDFNPMSVPAKPDYILGDFDLYLSKMKQFALYHGKCDILNGIMELTECVQNMRLDSAEKQSKSE